MEKLTRILNTRNIKTLGLSQVGEPLPHLGFSEDRGLLDDRLDETAYALCNLDSCHPDCTHYMFTKLTADSSVRAANPDNGIPQICAFVFYRRR